MPPQPLIDLSRLDVKKTIATHEEIYQALPHRHEFSLLDGFCHLDLDSMEMAAYVDLGKDDFWVRGHIPGRPLFPGVLMIESSAQMISYFVLRHTPMDGFIGFGAVDAVKFRGTVTTGDRLLLLGKMKEIRGGRRAIGLTQGFVDGQMVYQGTITGMMV